MVKILIIMMEGSGEAVGIPSISWWLMIFYVDHILFLYLATQFGSSYLLRK